MLVMLTLLQSILASLHKRREQLERAVIGGAAERLALEILRRLDRAVRLHRHGEGRLVEHHIDRDRRVLGLLGRELDQRVDVAEADVVGAVRDQRYRCARAVALVERDLEPLGFEVAAVLRQEEHPLRALVFPVQHQLELGLRVGGRRNAEWNGEHGRADQRENAPIVSSKS